MTAYRPVRLTHANLNRPVHVILGSIGGYFYSESAKATVVLTNSGQIPVAESPEQIDKLILKANTPGGETNE